jgi:uncharacterized membrane protein
LDFDAGSPPWPDRVLAAVAYCTFLPAAVLLFLPRFKGNSYIRFHSLQSIFFSLACLILSLVLRLADSALALLPMGLLVIFLTWGIAAFAAGVLWLALVIKALQGEWLRLPLLDRIVAKAAKPAGHA